MPDLQKYSIVRIMTLKDNDHSNGFPPPPVIELTLEQEFQLKKIEALLEKADKDDIITVFMALQEQCYILQNNVANLVKKW